METLVHLLVYGIAGIAMVVLAGFLLYYAGRLLGLGFMRSYVEVAALDDKRRRQN